MIDNTDIMHQGLVIDFKFIMMVHYCVDLLKLALLIGAASTKRYFGKSAFSLYTKMHNLILSCFGNSNRGTSVVLE
jgi:hypothetical protein